ncbi:MAG: bifunctional oligoribonuclease/PAP phosphatase NrnA [Patescibacteria group bacterium]|nr:bifunctional oligoribonuclease/PAP phosphatase NrnA [Patescibacteria group bacterium]MDD5566673.1 bifunctional oligoribonuclease/PAP phosphatase NrnA [Patescibacteria group bacterium]
MIWETINQKIQAAGNILILNPKDSDGDSLGSSLALAHYLKSLEKPHLVFAAKPPSSQLDYLPGFEEISSDLGSLDLNSFDLVIAVDFADLKMLGFAPELIGKLLKKTIINIDHHPTNFRYGQINVVEPTAAATSELLFYFFEDLNLPYDKLIATCLLSGIIHDTGSFAHLNTTPSVIEISARLLVKGARLKTITAYAQNKSLPTLKLWGVALSRLTHNQRYGLSTTVITQKDLAGLNTNGEATEGIANFLNNLTEAKAIMVLKEDSDGRIRGSLRTTTSGVDVSRLAALLGGGGHKKASGFNLRGKLIHTGRYWQIV